MEYLYITANLDRQSGSHFSITATSQKNNSPGE